MDNFKIISTISVFWRRFNYSTFFHQSPRCSSYVVALPMEPLPNEIFEEDQPLRKDGISYFLFEDNCPQPVAGTTPLVVDHGYGYWHQACLSLTNYGYRFGETCKNESKLRSIDALD